MLLFQLIVDGLVHGCAIAVVAVTFSYVYVTTGIFHVAHAGIFSLAGYLAWFFVGRDVPLAIATVFSSVLCAAFGALIQKSIYEPLVKRKSTPLVQLIASIGIVAVIQNSVAMIFTPNVLQFDRLNWRTSTFQIGLVDMTYAQALSVLMSLIVTIGLILFSSQTMLGRRIRAVSSNRSLAEITRLRPYDVYIYVLAISSGLVAIPGVFMGIDEALQPYTSMAVLLTAVIAVIAGGVGSLRGAFIVSLVLGVTQNLVLAFVPGRWSQALTFAIFIAFILVKPTGLFKVRMVRAS